MKLLNQVRRACRTKHLSLRTEKAYVRWARRFVLYHGTRHPLELDEANVRAFLTHLAVERQVAASTQNQALSALLFLYAHILGRPLGDLGEIVRAKRPKRLPVVLTRAEVKATLGHLQGTHHLVSSLLYGSGLRLLEGLRLRVKDVEFTHSQIIVRDGKGQKDRVTVLPESLAKPLKRQLKKVKLQHEEDLDEGYGTVYLPYALARKYPATARSWGWQYVFFEAFQGPTQRRRTPASPLRKDPCAARHEPKATDQMTYQTVSQWWYVVAMAKRRKYDPAVKAQVIAVLLTGQGAEKVAHRHRSLWRSARASKR